MPYPKVCPKGLYFDDSTFVCNWPHTVNCKNGNRRHLFGQVSTDLKANKIAAIPTTPIHEGEAVQDKTGNKTRIPRYLSSSRSQTNVESESIRKSLTRSKTINNNYFYSRNPFLAENIPSRHKSFTSVMAASLLPQEKHGKISTSKKSVIKDTPIPHVFSKKMPWDKEMMVKRGLSFRETGLKHSAKKEINVAVSQNKSVLSSTFGIEGNTSPPRSFLNQLKENRVNKTAQAVSYLLQETLHSTNHSNRIQVQDETKDIPGESEKIEFPVKDFESEESQAEKLRVRNQHQISELKQTIRQSPASNLILLTSSISAKNHTLKKEKESQSKSNKEYNFKFQCRNSSNCIENNEKMKTNSSEFSSLTENFSHSDVFTVSTDLNDCNASMKKCENKQSVNEDTLIIVSSRIITDKTPTSNILLGSSNANQSNFNSINNEKSVRKFYLSENPNESQSYTKKAEKISTVASYYDFNKNLLTSGIPKNMIELDNKLMNKTDFNKTKRHKDTVKQEKYNLLIKPTESLNSFKDSNFSVFTTKDHSTAYLDPDSEAGRDRKQKHATVLLSPQEAILNSKENDRFISNISKVTKIDLLKTTTQNVRDVDHLNRISKGSLTFEDQHSYVELLRPTSFPFHKTKYKKRIENRIKNQEKLTDHNDVNITDSIKNRKPFRNNAEQRKDVVEFNRTYTEHEISSLMTVPIKAKNVKLTAKIFKTHDKYGKDKNGQKSSSDLAETSPPISVRGTMETLNNDEHIEFRNVTSRKDSISIANFKTANEINSEIKATKIVNKRNRYKKVDFSTFSVQKNIMKNNEPFQNFLYRKLVEIFRRFVRQQINTTELLSSLRTRSNTSVKRRNKFEFGDTENYKNLIRSTRKISDGNPYTINATEQTPKSEYLDSKSNFTETTNPYEISFSEINKPVKAPLERTVKSLQNVNKNSNILYTENSSSDKERFSDSDKIDYSTTINVSAVQYDASTEFVESVKNSEEIQQKDNYTHLNSSTKIVSTNSSVDPKNIRQDAKSNLDEELITITKTDEPKITNNIIRLYPKTKTPKENESEGEKPKEDNNKNFSKNKTSHMFHDMMSFRDSISTSNAPILNAFHENETDHEKHQNSNTEKVQITDSNGSSVNMSKHSRSNSKIIDENLIWQGQTFAPNASKDFGSTKKKENEFRTDSAKKGNKSLQNTTSKRSDILNIPINVTEYLLAKLENISSSYNETMFHRHSKNIIIPNQKRMAVKQRHHFSPEPEIVTAAEEAFEESEDQTPENNNGVLETTSEKEQKLYTGNAKVNGENQSRLTGKKELNEKEKSTHRNKMVENTKTTLL